MINPAIDLQRGQSVRLKQGDFDQATLIENTPLAQVERFQAVGIDRLHLVDLDGARLGHPANQAVVKAIRDSFTGMIELSGGIRTAQAVADYLKLGIDRVILGSVAVKDPQLTRQVLNDWGSARIVIGVDGKDGMVATEGWLSQSTVPMANLIGRLVEAGAVNFIVTDVAQDGMMAGPNLNLLGDLQAQFPTANIIASGGIRNLADIDVLKRVGVKEAVVGRAMFEGTLTLEEIKEANANAN